MEVKCPKCQMLYHLDERHITGDGVNVQCTNCHNIFKVQIPASVPARSISGWHLMKPDGTIINFAHLGELQRLILEHKAHLEDKISKDGQTYKRLSDMPEFAPLFRKRDQQITGEKQSPAGGEPIHAEPRVSTPPVQSVVTPISTPPEEEIDIYGRPKKRGKGGILIAVGILALIVVVAAGALFMKDILFGARLTEEEANALKTAIDDILLSDYPELKRAYDSLEKYTKNTERPPKQEILATLTLSILLRGELLKLENAVVEKRIRENLKADKYSEVAKRLNEQFNERQRLIQEISNQTMPLLKRLDNQYGGKPLAKLVSLEYIRVQAVFDPQSAEKGIKILEELKGIKDFPYYDRLKFIEGDLLLKTDETRSSEAIRLMEEVISKEPKFILPRFMLARYYVIKNEYAKAMEQIEVVVSTNPQNSVAKSLKESIEDLLRLSDGQTHRTSESIKKEEEKVEGERREEKRDAEAAVGEKEVKVGGTENKEAAVKKLEKREVVEQKVRPEKTSGNYALLIKEAKRLAANGLIDKAAEAFLQASEIEPTLAEPFLLMGWMYIDAGKNEQAVNSFQRATRLKGNKCEGYMGLGEANKYMKKNSEAKKYYQIYLEQCPNGPDAATAKNNLNTLK